MRRKLKTVAIYLKSLLKKRKRWLKLIKNWINEIINFWKIIKRRNRKKFEKRRIVNFIRRIT